MAGLQNDDNSVIQDFHTWRKSTGQIGSGNDGFQRVERTFIPYTSVEAYLNQEGRLESLIRAIFPDDDPGKLPDAETIRDSHLKVFCILVSIAKGRYINHFIENWLNDSNLPLQDRPSTFPEDSRDTKFWESFYDRQWEFSVKKFAHNTGLHFDARGWILPIVEMKKIGGGGSAVIYKIKLHEDYDSLVQHYPDNPTSHTYILKTYRKPEARTYFDNEVSSFKALKACSHIIGFYGSFVWAGTYNILLEYADKGTLEDYFESTERPSTGRDITNFWDGLLNILGALKAIHGTPERGSYGSPIMNGWHQDVSPRNILVKSRAQKSKYEVKFLLTDFGLSHFRKAMSANGTAQDRHTNGTRTYGAPECYSPESDIKDQPISVSPVVDIWSAGCVLSEAALWVLFGKGHLDQYRHNRRDETSRIAGFTDIGCFHDGTDALKTVTETHEYMLESENISKPNHITKEVLRMVQDMLLRADGRPSAQALYVKSRTKLDKAREILRMNPDEGPFWGTYLNAHSSESLAQSGPRTPPELPHEYDTFRPRAGSQDKHRLPRSQTIDPIKVPDYFGLDPKHPDIDEDEESDRQNENEDAEDAPGPSRALLSMKGKEGNWSSNPYIKRNSTEPHKLVIDSRSQGYRAINPANSAISRTTKPGGVKNKPPGRLNLAQEGQPPLLHPPPPGSRKSSSSSTMSPDHGKSRQNSGSAIVGLQLAHGALEDHSQSSSLSLPSEESNLQPPPQLSISDAFTWKHQREQLGWKNPEAESLFGPLHDRDFAFLIDDSASMRPHWSEVIELFGILSRMVKKYNRDGLDLHYASSSRKEHHKKTTILIDSLKKHSLSKGQVNLKDRLGTLLEEYKIKLREPRSPPRRFGRGATELRRYNIYIFTDGIWQPHCDMEPIIRGMVDCLERLGLHNAQIGIQFIRFGNNAEAIKRLEYLDSGLGYPPGKDIVDTEPADRNVYKMMLGAINPWFDGDIVKECSNEATNLLNSE